MIGYFVKSGDTDVHTVFHPYINELREIVGRRISNNIYGEGLELILIEYHLEGQFLPMLEKRVRLLPYRKSEQAIATIVGIPKSFADMPEIEKKKLLTETTIESVELVKSRMIKKGFTKIDFPRLMDDLQKCVNEYLGSK